MQLTINKTTIENAIKQILPFVEKKDQTNVTSCIKLNLKDNILTLDATDYIMGARLTITNLSNTKDGICLIKGDMLLKAITRLRNDDIKLEVVDNNLIIKQGRSRAKLEITQDDFPALNLSDNMQKLDVNINDLRSGFLSVLPAVDTNNPKVELSGAYLNISDKKLDIASTDTKRLFVKSYDTDILDDIEIIVPKNGIVEILKVLDDNSEIFIDDVNIMLQNDNLMMFSKLINGKYPAYERVIPLEFKYILELNKSDLISAIKFVTAIEQNITLDISKKEIKITSLDDHNPIETYIENVKLPIKEDIKIKLNSNYLLDFLGSIDTDNFELCINEIKMPFVARSNGLICVVMPLMENER